MEVVLAANLTPVDLNNLFIADPVALARVSQAEAAGFPRTLCAWIKGHLRRPAGPPGDSSTVIVACQGDCSNTQALGEILEAEGREVIHFKFPYPRNREQLAREIEALTARLGADCARSGPDAGPPGAPAPTIAPPGPPHLGDRPGDRARRISSVSSPAPTLPRTSRPTNKA